MPRRTARTPLETAVHLALALPLALALAGCADCGGGGGDAGPDGGTTTDGGDEDQCEFIGGDCSEDADCCGELVCLDDGVCGNAPGCEDNDAFAGTPASPADLDGLGENMPLACQGFPFLDVFTIDAAAGDILRITMQTDGIAPNTQVGQGQADIDVYLLDGPPTGVTNQNGGNLVDGPILDAGATELSTEHIVFEVTETATYYVAVTVWAGPDTLYSLSLERGTACDFDADCAGDAFCQVAVDPNLPVVIQECATWTAPGCGNGDDEAGGDVHSDSGAVALTGSVDGLSCTGDLDVFSFEKALTERAFITLSAPDLAGEDFIVASIIDAEGVLFDLTVLEPGADSVDYSLGVGSPAGTYYVYLDQVGPSTGDVAYTIGVDLQPLCRTDADCAGGRTCGDEVFGGGPVQVCLVADDPCSDDDSDNSRTGATAVSPGSDVTAGVCMGGQDIYEIVLEGAATDVELSIDWSGTEDLDLYVYAEDGTLLGAGWYGTGGEVWEGTALPAGRLYAWVSAYACNFDAQGAPIPCDDVHEYTIAVTETPSAGCTDDASCVAGGATPNDPGVSLTCRSVTVETGDVDAGPDDDDDGDAGPAGDGGELDGGEPDGGEPDAGEEEPAVDAGGDGTTTVQVCVRPVEAALLTLGGGADCFDNVDCSSLLCPDGYCTSECAAEADCEETLGAGEGYCFELSETPICLKPCTTDEDCDRVFGTEPNLSCTDGECVQ